MTARAKASPEATEETPDAAARRMAGEVETLRLQVAALQRENDALREAAAPTRRHPQRPAFGLTEGERQDLIAYGVTRDAYTGETMTAADHGLEPATEDGRTAQEKEHTRRNAQGRTRDASQVDPPTEAVPTEAVPPQDPRE